MSKSRVRSRKMVVYFRNENGLYTKIWHSTNFNNFYQFLNKLHPTWKWCNVWNKEENYQVYNFTCKSGPGLKYI